MSLSVANIAMNGSWSQRCYCALELEIKKKKTGLATQGRDPPSSGAPKACSWEQEAKICPRGREGRGGGSASRAWHLGGVQEFAVIFIRLSFDA